MPGFLVEYAKSGRSSCKGCKSPIAQEALRFGRLVPSPHFDGEVPMWYHSGCFKDRVEDFSLFRGLLDLKPDDQRRLREKFGGKQENSANPDDSMPIEEDSKVCVGYAASGRSTCRHCSSAIPVGALRLGPLVPSDRGSFRGLVPAWHCLECFFLSPHVVFSVSELDGFSSLEAEDAATLRKIVEKNKPGGEKKEKTKGKRKKAENQENQEKEDDKKSFKRSKASVESSVDFSSLTVAALKEALKSRGLPVAGKKSQLVERLQEAEKTDEGGASAAAASSSSSSSSSSSVDDSDSARLIEAESRARWSIKDSIKSLSRNQVRDLLEQNGCCTKGDPGACLDLLVDSLLYGALPDCPSCGESSLFFNSSEGEYRCRTQLEWSPCLYSSLQAERRPFVVPEEYLELNDFLASYRFNRKARKPVEALNKIAQKGRALQESRNAAAEEKRKKVEEEKDRRLSASVARSLFQGLQIFLQGKFADKKMKEIIKERGGEIAKTLEAGVSCLVANGEISSAAALKKFEAAASLGLPVLNETFIQDSVKNNKLADAGLYCIGKPNDAQRAAVDALQARALKSSGSSGALTKMRMKGRAAVDEASELTEAAHVLDEGGDSLYTATLNLTEITRNINSFYLLQLLENDARSRWFLFRRYGRIGTNNGGNKIEEFQSKAKAKESFKALYLEKTGNSWESRADAPKRPGKFYPVEVQYGEEKDEGKAAALAASSASSKLDARVRAAVEMFFDITRMASVLVEFEIDTKKAPLGKLSKAAIKRGFQILKELSALLEGGAPTESQLLGASNHFYSIIPHDFGSRPVEILRSLDQIQKKLEILDALGEMEIATSLIDSGTAEAGENIIDVHYRQLRCPLSPVEAEAEEYSIIQKYIKNTHGPTHGNFSLELLNAFKVNREGENSRFQKFAKSENRFLFWHGSRLTNFVGILSQGLRIAPPEAPVTGYMFGRGLYFADSVSKSANYCFSTASNNIGFLLLCEVATGDCREVTAADYEAGEKLGPGQLCTKGVGSHAPDPKDFVVLDDGVVVPCGKMKARKVRSDLLYNEFIVYDVAQVQIRYLVKVKFNFKR